MTLIEKELKNAYIGYGITLLPSDYQQVEYIESSGTQYINTQFTYTQTTGEVKTKMMSKEFGSYYHSQRYTGAYNTNNTRTFMLYNNTPTAYIGIGGNDYSTGFNISIDTIYNIDAKIETAGTCVYTLNGQSTTISYSGTIVTGKPYFIFCDNENGSPANYGKDRLYYFKMYEAGSLVRDFIPCYRKADGAIGLYDLVDDTFYANAGSGVFAKGGNVYPDEHWQPGANTVLYYPLVSDAVDIVNGVTLASYGTTNYTTVGGVTSANFTRSNCLYNKSVNGLPQGDVAKTISLWAYITAGFIGWAGFVMYGEDSAGKAFGLSGYSNSNSVIMTRGWSVSATYTPTQNVWKNYIITYSPENKRILYENGVSVVTWSETAPTTGTRFYIGANLDSEISNKGFKGNLSKVILENKERTAQEVSDYFDQTKGDYGIS